jgi:hypothetical protein
MGDIKDERDVRGEKGCQRIEPPAYSLHRVGPHQGGEGHDSVLGFRHRQFQRTLGGRCNEPNGQAAPSASTRAHSATKARMTLASASSWSILAATTA